jgi:hypothetical protein
VGIYNQPVPHGCGRKLKPACLAGFKSCKKAVL